MMGGGPAPPRSTAPPTGSPRGSRAALGPAPDPVTTWPPPCTAPAAPGTATGAAVDTGEPLELC